MSSARRSSARRRPARPPAEPAPAGQVRIIGGRWRSRRLRFPAVDGLRPTGDRLRETLFNWLQPHLPGARCLDLFAGSGALGFEAASRGAGAVVLVDAQPTVVEALRANRALLAAEEAVTIVHEDALEWLERGPSATLAPFDLVFLDPPFQAAVVALAATRLDAGGWLAPAAWVYIETAVEHAPAALPAHWHLHRDQCSGRVNCRLYRCI